MNRKKSENHKKKKKSHYKNKKRSNRSKLSYWKKNSNSKPKVSGKTQRAAIRRNPNHLDQNKQEKKWKQLSQITFMNGGGTSSNPMRINGNIVCIDSSYDLPNVIYSYQVNNDQWVKIMSLKERIISLKYAYNDKTKLIYCINNQLDIYQIDIQKQSIILYPNYTNKFHGFIFWPQILCIGDTIHIFADKSHCILDKNTKEIQIKHTFNFDIYGDSAIYIKSKQIILMFTYKTAECYQYSLINKKWNKLDIHIPNHLQYSVIIKPHNERYIIFIGGMRDHESIGDVISVYDLKYDTLSISTIKCPYKTAYKAVIMNDQQKSRLITFGFIRNSLKSDKFTNNQFPPEEIIKLIVRCMQNEYIHLIEGGGGTGHWKLNVNQILQSTH